MSLCNHSDAAGAFFCVRLEIFNSATLLIWYDNIQMLVDDQRLLTNSWTYTGAT